MKLLILLFLFPVAQLFAQNAIGNFVTLRLNTDSLVMRAGEKFVDVDFSLLNQSDSNLIFYRLSQGIDTDPARKIELYCDIEKTGAGLVMLVFDTSMKLLTPMHWYVQEINHPVTKTKLDSAMKEWKIKAMNGTSFVKKKETIRFHENAYLEEHALRKGTYSVQLICFTGKKIVNFVSEEQQKIDEQENDAKIFKGCIKSKLYKLVIP